MIKEMLEKLRLSLIITKCKKCDEDFLMGENGTVDGCDRCTGYERDENGDLTDAVLVMIDQESK